MTMEHRPERTSPSSEPAGSPQGTSRLDALIGETLRERADGVAPAPDALLAATGPSTASERGRS